jgi:antitoxin (DNA-binding transcriptional repressor) of toxin-antitoxin stability system
VRVGTKELKNHLSHYLRLVRAGESVLVTDRGAVIAEIRKARPAVSDEEALQALENDHLATIGRGRLPDFEPVRLARRGSVSAMIVADRA